MARRKSLEKSEREQKWGKIFNALVNLSQNQQKDREILEERMKFYLDVIYQMKRERNIESLKVEMMLGLKEREAFAYKDKYENSENELADYIKCFDHLSEKCSESKKTSGDVNNKDKTPGKRSLQDDIKRLKTEFTKYKCDKDSEISALLSEKNFVWNQFKKLESDLTEQLRKKSDEVEQANGKALRQVNQAEELQNSNEKLRTELAKRESDSVKKSEEISRLTKEIERLKSGSGSGTPVLRLCHRKDKNSTIDRKAITAKKELDASHNIEKITHTKPNAHKSTGGKAPKRQLGTQEGSSSSLKRKAVDIINVPDTPKLFTSAFKVPKLKQSATPRT